MPALPPSIASSAPAASTAAANHFHLTDRRCLPPHQSPTLPPSSSIASTALTSDRFHFIGRRSFPAHQPLALLLLKVST
jgi:hypothetical protein